MKLSRIIIIFCLSASLLSLGAAPSTTAAKRASQTAIVAKKRASQVVETAYNNKTFGTVRQLLKDNPREYAQLILAENKARREKLEGLQKNRPAKVDAKLIEKVPLNEAQQATVAIGIHANLLHLYPDKEKEARLAVYKSIAAIDCKDEATQQAGFDGLAAKLAEKSEFSTKIQGDIAYYYNYTPDEFQKILVARREALVPNSLRDPKNRVPTKKDSLKRSSLGLQQKPQQPAAIKVTG